MAWWLTVYCTRSVADLTAADLARGLRDGDPQAPAGVDYDTLAEGFELDEDLVAPALAALRVEPPDGSSIAVEIHFRPGSEHRPISVHLWDDPARIAEELEETRENREPPPAAERTLAGTVAIVALELGFPMLENMGIVIATEAARWLAQKGAGVICDDDNQWFEVRDGGALEPLA
jgi:hypothetical protein